MVIADVCTHYVPKGARPPEHAHLSKWSIVPCDNRHAVATQLYCVPLPTSTLTVWVVSSGTKGRRDDGCCGPSSPDPPPVLTSVVVVHEY